ncbi:MAG TPA: sodium:solute symporter [Chitinophagaceae bacterium]|nr:sodium:solute symporter [Chitinophagaceae bacterium]
MSSSILLFFVLAYFALLLVVAYFTSKKSNNESFFIGNRNSNWMLVAFGMIGTSLSGVTFVSVPGTVGASGFQYFQVVIGYFLGYLVVAYVLLPLYYKLQLTSIYSYLQNRIGMTSYKTGAFFFIISRTLGATARLYLVVNILQLFILNNMGIPFWLTTFVILLLILLYTFEGGVKTIVYTDTLQTTFMLLGLVVCIIAIMSKMDSGFFASLNEMKEAGYTKVFNTDLKSGGFFLKQIIGGAFITIGMTGLDQEMMQKNISVNNIGNSQKNMLTFSTVILFVNFLFLFLGGCLYLFATKNGIDIKGDDLFPAIALNGYLSAGVSILFIIGLISALFPSADGALTALTSSFCIDILGLKRNEKLSEAEGKKTRITVHLIFAIIFFACVMIFKLINDKSIIDVILKLAGYTYGPLLGLFSFGILTKRIINDKIVLPLCIIAPLLTLVIDMINNAEWFIKKLTINEGFASTLTSLSSTIFGGYKIGIELLIINGLITFLLLFLFSKKGK